MFEQLKQSVIDSGEHWPDFVESYSTQLLLIMAGADPNDLFPDLAEEYPDVNITDIENSASTDADTIAVVSDPSSPIPHTHIASGTLTVPRKWYFTTSARVRTQNSRTTFPQRTDGMNYYYWNTRIKNQDLWRTQYSMGGLLMPRDMTLEQIKLRVGVSSACNVRFTLFTQDDPNPNSPNTHINKIPLTQVWQSDWEAAPRYYNTSSQLHTPNLQILENQNLIIGFETNVAVTAYIQSMTWQFSYNDDLDVSVITDEA